MRDGGAVHAADPARDARPGEQRRDVREADDERRPRERRRVEPRQDARDPVLRGAARIVAREVAGAAEHARVVDNPVAGL